MNMKFNILILLYILQICNAQNKVVKELVEGIIELNEQTLTWTYPKNSNNYKGENYDPNVATYDGNYDFIICGASTAGSLIANRLSQNESWKILVIEAGEQENEISQIPKMAEALKTSKYNWGYLTVPQENRFKGYIDNRLTLNLGKAVGGKSIMDFMTYIRGNKEDFNAWGEINPGWTYQEVLSYFKKTENATFENADPKYHGTSGELNVDYSRIFNNIGQAFLNSYVELGRNILDYNAENQMGASRLQLIQNNGKRDSSAQAFITSIRNNSNVLIYSNSFLTKLLINIQDQDKQVYGVQYVRKGVLHYATVSKEVILSMGAINIPKILMLSGIGPKNHLDELNIPVIQNLNVGSGLWDNLVYTTNVFKVNITERQLNLKKQVKDYLRGSGPLTAPFSLQAIGFNNVMGDSLNIPDVEYLLHSSFKPESNYTVFKNLEGYTKETYDNVIKPTLGVYQWGLDIISLHPKSRGSVRLQSACPFDNPIVDPNYFSVPSDVEPFINAIYDTINIAKTEAFQKYNSTLIRVCHPACDCSNWGTKAFWGCMVQNLAKPLSEFSGTTKMGPITDPTAVVDNQLRVHGINGVRVADCSIIPNTTSGNGIAIAYMIGEIGSSLIRAAYSN